ncbi:MAG: hypothetical protein R3C53_01325 [Pirellulaceae bacterium]
MSQKTPPGYRPELPDWGVYLRSPAAGVDWIHPDDISLAMQWIPSSRVFKRVRWDGEFYWLMYGPQSLRVRPTLWNRVSNVDLEVGQQVELRARHGAHEAGIYRLADMCFSPLHNRVEFYLRRDKLRIRKAFCREDLLSLQVHYALRSGYYQHAPPKSALPNDIELLNVGDVFEDQVE